MSKNRRPYVIVPEAPYLDVMKFHHLGQHLLDTNCLLLILKMFGLQEVSASVVSKADSPDNKYASVIPHSPQS